MLRIRNDCDKRIKRNIGILMYNDGNDTHFVVVL